MIKENMELKTKQQYVIWSSCKYYTNSDIHEFW